MGTSYFFKNNTRKSIVKTELYDITKNLLIVINQYGWNISDEIDIIDDLTNIQEFVNQGYTIDYIFW
jgi:hypothetical protein